MKIKPYLHVTYRDTWILGPTAAVDTREFRIGLSFIVCEVGLCFIPEAPCQFGCSGCGKIGEDPVGQLPDGWEKRYHIHFLCSECIAKRKANQRSQTER